VSSAVDMEYMFNSASAFSQTLCGAWVAKSSLATSWVSTALIAATTADCTCTCKSGGTAATGDACTTDGQERCVVCRCDNGQASLVAECPNNEEHCASCNDGYELSSSNQCEECPAGKYHDKTGDLSCKECNAGMYNDQTGQGSCTFCEDGKTTVKGTNLDCQEMTSCSDVDLLEELGKKQQC